MEYWRTAQGKSSSAVSAGLIRSHMLACRDGRLMNFDIVISVDMNI